VWQEGKSTQLRTFEGQGARPKDPNWRQRSTGQSRESSNSGSLASSPERTLSKIKELWRKRTERTDQSTDQRNRPKDPSWRPRKSSQSRESSNRGSLASSPERTPSKIRELWRKLSASVRGAMVKSDDSGVSDVGFIRIVSSVMLRRGAGPLKNRRKEHLSPPTLLEGRVDNARIENKHEELLNFEITFQDVLGRIIRVLDEMRKSKDDCGYEVAMPLELREGRDKIVICNFYEMHNFHKNIMAAGIRNNLYNAEKLRDLFQKEADTMKTMYTKYYTEQGKITHIVKSHENYFKKLRDRAGVDVSFHSLLTKPNQHITKYHLFFADLAQIARKAHWPDAVNLYEATVEITKDLTQSIYNGMSLQRITNLPPWENVHGQGNLLHKGPLGCKVDQKPRFGSAIMAKLKQKKADSAEVFLFKLSVIVCHNKGKTKLFTPDDEYSYWAKFSMNKLQVLQLKSWNIVSFSLCL
jgi:hypothetical protein